jgi:hypothetical protein
VSRVGSKARSGCNSFEGKLTSSKWARMAKCSQDTAGQDIADLVEKGILGRVSAGGRSTNYHLLGPAASGLGESPRSPLLRRGTTHRVRLARA